TLAAEMASDSAAKADEMQARNEKLGPLHGLPVAHKDLAETRGIRTTFGSPLYKDKLPTESHTLVERLRRAGAITVGKTNTPEFGAGSQTFNTVFGATRNPDVALFLSAIAGPDPRSPLSLREDPAQFRAPLGKNFKGVRVAWWRGLGGIPFEPGVRAVVDSTRKVFEDLGCIVEEAEPDFAGVDAAFPLLQIVGRHRDEMSVLQLAYAFEEATHHGRRRPSLLG